MAVPIAPVARTAPEVIMVLSRKGGVGKSSIALSAAMQLAAKGTKVAYLDLDTQGAHLSQLLLTDRDTERKEPGSDEHEYTFDPGTQYSQSAPPASTERPPVCKRRYIDRPNFTWRFPTHLRYEARPAFKELEGHLVIGSAFKKENAEHLAQIKNVEANLGLILCSPYLRDLDVVNNLQLTEQGQKVFRDFLTQIVKEFAAHQYEYIFMDNSPGLSYLSANGMAWAIERANAGQGTMHLWFVGGASWWEQGLIGYETNVYPEVLEKGNPTIVVNRVFGRWLGLPGFGPGSCLRLADMDRSIILRMAAELFAIPLWIAGASDKAFKTLVDRFFPPTYSLAVLGDDDTVRNSMLRSQDEKNATEMGPVPESATPQQRIDRFSQLSQKFLSGFLSPAVAATVETAGDQAATTSFHRHVRTALVEPLEKQTEAESHERPRRTW